MRLASVTSRTTEILERLWKVIFICDDAASCKNIGSIMRRSVNERQGTFKNSFVKSEVR